MKETTRKLKIKAGNNYLYITNLETPQFYSSGYYHEAVEELTGMKLQEGESIEIEITTKIIKKGT